MERALVLMTRVELADSCATAPAPTFNAARFCVAAKLVAALALMVRFGDAGEPALVLRLSVPAETFSTAATGCDCVPSIVNPPAPSLVIAVVAVLLNDPPSVSVPELI